MIQNEKKYPVTEERLKDAFLPKAFYEIKFGDYWPEPHRGEILEHLLAVAEKSRRGEGFIVIGPSGSGKTSFCALYMKAIMEYGASCFFSSFGNILPVIEKSEVSGVVYPGINAKVYSYDLLVLNNLTSSMRNVRGFDSKVTALLESRIDNQKSTIVNTCMGLEEIVDTFSDSFIRQLQRSCNNVLILPENKNLKRWGM